MDLVIVIGRRHLISLLRDFEAHYNSHRPHRGIGLDAPERLDVDVSAIPLGQIRRTKVVGGAINEHHAIAA